MGVTRIRDNETEYSSLGIWEKEFKDYKILVKIPTFSKFRIWKAFAVWRKNVRTKKISKCKNLLKENLFIVNDVSFPVLSQYGVRVYGIKLKGNLLYLSSYQHEKLKYLQIS